MCQRPYHVEYTGSRQLPEVKLRRASSVRGWVTASEYGVSLTFYSHLLFLSHSSFRMQQQRKTKLYQNHTKSILYFYYIFICIYIYIILFPLPFFLSFSFTYIPSFPAITLSISPPAFSYPFILAILQLLLTHISFTYFAFPFH